MELKHYASRYINWWKPVDIVKDWRYDKVNRYLKEWNSVLDIWCANWWFYEVWKHKNIDFNGLDYNQEMVSFCKGKWLKVEQCDLSKDKIPFEDESFDFIYCSHVLEHLLSNEQIGLFYEISRVLKNDWTLIMLTPTPYSWYFWDDPTHQRASTHGSLEHLSKDFWLEVIESKYSNLRSFSQNMQKWLRLPPLRWFMWEVYLIAKKVK